MTPAVGASVRLYPNGLPWDQSDCNLWMVGREEEWLLLKPVLILFPRKEAVLHGLIPIQYFMALVLHLLSS